MTGVQLQTALGGSTGPGWLTTYKAQRWRPSQESSFQTLPSFSWSCFLLSGLPGDVSRVTPNPCFLEARCVTLFGERIFAEVIS